MAIRLSHTQYDARYSVPLTSTEFKQNALFPPNYCPRKPSPTARTFPLFPLLPPELRLRTWALAAPHKRVIEVRSWGPSNYYPTRYSIHPHYLPAIFHVCKESRAEALRIYKRVEIGVSAAVRIEGQKYIDWNYHPANPNAQGRIVIGTGPLPHAIPHKPAVAYISWEHDIIYLGPEFQLRHLLKFLSAKGKGRELEGLRYLALDRKLWVASESSWENELRNSLWSLRSRQSLTEVIVVPDDEERCLTDRWYHGKHDITMEWPGKEHNFELTEELEAVADKLEEWLRSVWKHQNRTVLGNRDSKLDDGEIQKGKGVKDSIERDAGSLEPPKVSVMSVKRNGQRMRPYTDGASEIRKAMNDMRAWHTWTPPTSP